MRGDNSWLSMTVSRPTVCQSSPRRIVVACRRDRRLVGTSAYILSPGQLVRLKPIESSRCVANAIKGLLQALQKYNDRPYQRRLRYPERPEQLSTVACPESICVHSQDGWCLAGARCSVRPASEVEESVESQDGTGKYWSYLWYTQVSSRWPAAQEQQVCRRTTVEPAQIPVGK